MPGLDESHRIAKREIPGSSLRSMSSRFALSSGAISELPVMFPPGRAKLATKPTPTGSLLAPRTMGIVVLACLAANPAGVPIVTMTSTRCCRQVCRKFLQSLSVSFGWPALDYEVLPFHITEFLKLARKRYGEE